MLLLLFCWVGDGSPLHVRASAVDSLNYFFKINYKEELENMTPITMLHITTRKAGISGQLFGHRKFQFMNLVSKYWWSRDGR